MQTLESFLRRNPIIWPSAGWRFRKMQCYCCIMSRCYVKD